MIIPLLMASKQLSVWKGQIMAYNDFGLSLCEEIE